MKASFGADLNAVGVETFAAPPKEKAAEDDAGEAAGAKLNPPVAADDAGAAAPKPNDAAEDDAGAAPKLNAPAAPALGAAGSSAEVFPAGLVEVLLE